VNGKQETIRQALVVLGAHLKEIHTVKEWAERMGYHSADGFSRIYFRRFNERPVKAIETARVLRILDLILLQPDLSGYEIAWETGLEDEKALYSFLIYHTGMNLNELRTLMNGSSSSRKSEISDRN